MTPWSTTTRFTAYVSPREVHLLYFPDGMNGTLLFRLDACRFCTQNTPSPCSSENVFKIWIPFVVDMTETDDHLSTGTLLLVADVI